MSIQSIFMIAVLSTSRLFLLLFPLRVMSRSLASLIPAVYLILISTLLVTLIFLEHVNPYFDVRYMFCTLTGLHSLDPDYQIPHHDLGYDHIIRIIWFVLTGVPFIPITLSFIASVYLINNSARSHQSVLASRRQSRAAVTILIVTLLYIMCNTPAAIVMLVTANWRYTHHTQTVQEMYTSLYLYYNSNFMFYYSWFIACPMSIGINSFLNPVIYYWRMSRFRSFILKKQLLTRETMRDTAVGGRDFRRQRAFRNRSGTERKDQVQNGLTPHGQK